MKRKAYSYIRMSTSIQLKGDSLRRQLELSKKYADEHGLELVDSLKDIGISAFRGKNISDGAFGEFLQSIKKGNIDPGSVLLVESLDRLSRDKVLTAFRSFTEILDNDIEIITLIDNQSYTANSVNDNVGQLFTTLGIMLRANDESKNKSSRLKSVWKNKRDNLGKKKYTTIAPSWLKYDKKDNEFIRCEQPVKTVQAIFELSTTNGMGTGSIVKHLNQNTHEYPPIGKSGKWHKSYVQKILNNRAVTGEFQPHQIIEGVREPTGEPIKEYFPQIITEELFFLSQAKQAERKVNGAGRKGNTFTNIFTRLITCGGCGATVIYRNKGELPKGGQYLKCGDSEISHNCNAPAWNYHDFEKSFFRFITELNINEILNDNESLNETKELQKLLASLDHQLVEKDWEYSTLIKRIGTAPESIAKDIINHAERVKNEVETTNKQRIQIQYKLIETDKNANEYNLGGSIEKYNEAIKGKNDQDKKLIRQKIHAEIKAIVSKIKLNNSDFLGQVYEIAETYDVDDLDELNYVDNNIPKKLIDELSKRGYCSEKKQIDFLNTEYGQRLHNHFTRSFTVIFKNGVTKQVISHTDTEKFELKFKPPIAKKPARS